VPGIDLGGAVIAARQAGLLETGGGHAMAAGFSLRADRVEDFRIFLNERLVAASALPGAATLNIEATVTVSGATTDLARSLQCLAPFGAGNEEPMLVLHRARVVRADRVGKESASIRMFVEGEGGGPRLKAMMFRARDGRLADALLARGDGLPLHLAGHLRADEWNGSVKPCFIVTDGAPA
jgi:single-stranded-DNA-specific exonuclease